MSLDTALRRFGWFCVVLGFILAVMDVGRVFGAWLLPVRETNYGTAVLLITVGLIAIKAARL